MTSVHKKPGVAFWASVVVVVVLVGYPASFGPACWITSRIGFGSGVVPVVYRPITRLIKPARPEAKSGLMLAEGPFAEYAMLLSAEYWTWQFIPEPPHAGRWGMGRCLSI